MIIGISNSNDLDLHLVVSGSHLHLKEENTSYNEIQSLNLKNLYEIPTYKKDKDDFSDISKSMALGLEQYPKFFKEINGEIIILLGDRFETLIAAISATLIKLPIAHIHGGDISEGAYDESFRHSITKMSHIHFPATEEASKILIQLGEASQNVINVGSLAIDNILNYELKEIDDISLEYNFNFTKPYCLITYHSCTLGEDPRNSILAILSALKKFPNFNYVFTYPNPDNGGQIIIDEINLFLKKNKNKTAIFVRNFGQLNYFTVLKSALFVIGNSSSGLIEAPYFNVPVINIGNRQNGRVRPKTVQDINDADDENKISLAIEKILTETDIIKPELLYGCGGATDTIINKLKTMAKPKLIKKFNKTYE